LELFFNTRLVEASQIATGLVRLLESIGDPTLTLSLLTTVMATKQETGEVTELLRLAELGIDLAEGDATKGNFLTGSPLTLSVAMRGMARCCLGLAGWKEDFERAVSMAQRTEPITRAAALYFTYIGAIMNGALLPTASVLRETEQALTVAEQSGEDVVLAQGRQYLGIILVCMGGGSRAKGFELLEQVRMMALERRYNEGTIALADIQVAEEKTRVGDFAGAVSLARSAVNEYFQAGGGLWTGRGTNALVEALVHSGSDADLQDAKVAVDRLAALPIEPGVVVYDIWLQRVRTLLARAQGDDATYREYRDHYRKMASELGFEGHMAWAEAMD
jgi:adenylate cyclase